ncbi:hypothetical protein [Pontibacter cellulosilyticus]|uniref:Lipoprotein n=1 Tax=Pontibacter cellulosilyticus TaxID=1720253 RepID=A0A923N7T4_9BACT|nr:hypothetical protein [Pontibacter cellulosilyticus]MBC5992060.1 hypothetical protein [Pontibacter cellulosilyticus]
MRKYKQTTMKLSKVYLLAVALAFAACQQDTERNEEGSLAETHPKLEKQLDNKSVSEPITEGRNPELYQRYRITMEEYQSSGNYVVGDIYRGRLAPLDAKSQSEISTQSNALNEGLKQGVNFAGKYTVVTVNCGTNCRMHYVIDRENGKIADKLQSSHGAKYSPDSRLFIINPPDPNINYQDCDNCAPEAYIFENGNFKQAPKN